MNRRLNILFIIPSAYPQGGVATWLDYIIPGLGKTHNVTVGLVSGKHHNSKEYLKQHPFESFLIIKNKTGSREGRLRALLEAMQVAEPDLVFNVNIPDSMNAIMRYRNITNRNVKMVMTVHGIELDYFNDAKQFSSILDAVVTTNRLTSKLINLLSDIPQNNIFYASYGVDNIGSPFRKEKKNEIIIAYSGRLEVGQKRAQDIPKLINILERKEIDFSFIIAGDGPMLPVIKNQLETQINSGKVKIYNWLTPDQLRNKVYKLADVLLIVSSWETGPIVAWEGMSDGLCVVTSRYIGSKSEGALKDAQNCLMFDIGDIESAAQAIIRLRDNNLLYEIASQGHQLVKQRYTKNHSIFLWNQAIEQIFNQQNQSKAGNEIKYDYTEGRLEKYLGVNLSEWLRELFGLTVNHTSPGSEWSHSFQSRANELTPSSLIKALKEVESPSVSGAHLGY